MPLADTDRPNLRGRATDAHGEDYLYWFKCAALRATRRQGPALRPAALRA